MDRSREGGDRLRAAADDLQLRRERPLARELLRAARLWRWRCRWMSSRGGRVRGPGPRSFEALRWLARLDVAGIEPLGFGRRATYSHVARLADAGLITRIYDRDGSVVAITPAGRRGIETPAACVPKAATHGLGLRHARAVSWVAARLTETGTEWLGRREVRSDPDWRSEVVWRLTRDGRYPDLGIVRALRLAVEVELWHRSPTRWRATLSGYAEQVASHRLGGVIYVSDRADVLAEIGRAAAGSACRSATVPAQPLVRAGERPGARVSLIHNLDAFDRRGRARRAAR